MKRSLAVSIVWFAVGCMAPPQPGDEERAVSTTTTTMPDCPNEKVFPARSIDDFVDNNWASEANPWVSNNQSGYIVTSQIWNNSYILIAGYNRARTTMVWWTLVGNAKQTVAGSTAADTLDAVIYFKALPGSIVNPSSAALCNFNDEAGQVGFQPIGSNSPGNNPFPTVGFCANPATVTADAMTCLCRSEAPETACANRNATCGSVTDNCNAIVPSCGACDDDDQYCNAQLRCITVKTPPDPPPVKCHGACI